MQDIELIIKQVDATMTMEGMALTDKDKERIRFCIGDDKKVEETIQELIKKYTLQQE